MGCDELMNKLQTLDLSFLDSMTIDDLIAQCKQFVEHYLSKSASIRLEKAYRSLRFEEVGRILKKALEQIKTNVPLSEYQRAEKAVRDKISNTNGIFTSFDKNERSRDDTMGVSSGTVIIIVVVIIAILAIAIISIKSQKKCNNKNIYSSKTVDEVFSAERRTANSISYTDKDKDLMNLICELSKIYDNTEHYFNS